MTDTGSPSGRAALLEPVRGWIADQVRTRVVGDDPSGTAAAIMEAPGPRWFADDRVIREVHADSSMFIGGLRAILLQSLHPLAMAGVAQHSDYRTDPWGRLQRTAEFLAATTFGPVPVAERAVAAVRRVHVRVVGVASDGRRYSANDPHLLRWVHVCEVDSFLAAHQRYGARRLTADEADEYVADMAVVARALGVNEPPRSVRELRAELREYRPELRGTTEAREAARFLLLEPPLPVAARPPYGLIAAAAASLLPVWARWPLRLPFLPVTETLLVRPAGEAVTNVLRWSLTRG
jgi:uncharacterized protein (DUF2236 family)